MNKELVVRGFASFVVAFFYLYVSFNVENYSNWYFVGGMLFLLFGAYCIGKGTSPDSSTDKINKIKDILNAWIEYQHPYMTKEVKTLILEIQDEIE